MNNTSSQDTPELSQDILIQMKIKHLDILQNIIDRAAARSSTTKVFAVTISAAVLSYSATSNNSSFLLYIVPIFLILAILDASYLNIERMCRTVFDKVRLSSNDWQTDFSVFPEERTASNWGKCFFSWSIFAFYIPIAVLLITASYC